MPLFHRVRYFLLASLLFILGPVMPALAAPRLSTFKGHPPVHMMGTVTALPRGMTPAQIKAAYKLPADGGTGTIAIIDAFDDANIERDLGVFSKQFNLPACTTANGCFEKHKMTAGIKQNANWSYETSLDVEWAHAIAPQAKILLVESKSGSGTDLIAAVDYAASRKDVVSVSMSWGGMEFPGETALDAHFAAANKAFFASSGDNGTGVSWPAVSKNVISVGGTSLVVTSSTGKVRETAWSGSGGGVSAYEAQPAYQTEYSIPRAKKMRAVPDVSFNADPATGFSVFRSTAKKLTAKTKGWIVLGGTSAGAPQWAAIHALGHTVSLAQIYADKASTANGTFFRDITSGSNGDCTYYCDARRHYDYVTGLGSPLTVEF